MRPLIEHQKKGLAYWLEATSPALLWEMRTGKTLVAVRGVQEKSTGVNLVTGPINVMDSWEKELTLEGESFFRAYAATKQNRIDALKKAFDLNRRVWILMNYEAARVMPQVAQLPLDYVIADESVKLKNPEALITKLFVTGFRSAKHRAILTGLISPESDLDVFCQFLFLHGRFLNYSGSDPYAYWKFRKKYFEHNEWSNEWVAKEGVQEMIKNAVHLKSSVLRRADAGMVNTKVYAKRFVEMNAEQKRLYDTVDKEFRWEASQSNSEEFQETMWATEKALWLSRIAGGFTPDGKTCISTAKPEEILYLLKNDLKGESVVVWYALRDELDHDQKFFEAKGIPVAVLHGGLFVPARIKNKQDFQSGKKRLFLVMQKLGDKGNDFSIASTEIYRSQEFSADLRAQSEDRIIHPLKTDPALYIDLLTRDTRDEVTSERVRQKVFDARETMTVYAGNRTTKKAMFVDMLNQHQKEKEEKEKSKLITQKVKKVFEKFDPDNYDPFKD